VVKSSSYGSRPCTDGLGGRIFLESKIMPNNFGGDQYDPVYRGTEEESFPKIEAKIKTVICQALTILTPFDGHDGHCIVCGYRVVTSPDDSKSRCKADCPATKLRECI